jgi:hypothetical protein
MPDRKPKPDRPTPHKEKLCKTCRRPIQWQKKYEQDWDILKYCSEACSGHHSGEKDSALEAAILSLLAERGDKDKTICPSEAAKAVGGLDSRKDWESLMEPARAAARRLVTQGKIVITQHGAVVNPSTAKGPIRLRLRQIELPSTPPPKRRNIL